jgi:Ca2+-binding RTX toxin-like protein
MKGRIGVLAVAFAIGAAGPASAAPPVDLTDDGNGKRWRQLDETVGMRVDQVAEMCPRDGETRCTGVLSGWIWATADQVRAVMGLYEPAILTAEPPEASGPEQFWTAAEFLTDMRSTFSVSGYGFHSTGTSGFTSSLDEAGQPVRGHVGYGWYPIGGGFSLGPNSSPNVGVWLWRPVTDDLTAPVITPSVSATPGSNGWHVSDVSVSWTVTDPETEVTERSGCDATSVTSDTAGTTITCTATSGGGTASQSVLVKRDTLRPTVTCASPPQTFEIYQLGAWVRAAVTDETSGPANPSASGPVMANTNTAGTFSQVVTGTDRAGLRTSVSCAYVVAIPTCFGETATIVGTALNNTINGTAGRDVIVALGGADRINGLGGDDLICGGDGPDVINGGDGADRIDGGASPDDLNGGRGNDFLDGGLHNDSLRGDDGRDTCVSGETRRSSCEA